MPSLGEGTYFTYTKANTRISGDSSRSLCASFRASSLNYDNIVVEIGSSDTTWNSGKGCNTHFALAVGDGINIIVFGMCFSFDNSINIGPSTLFDGNFHHICITYNSINSILCAYRDFQTPVCIVRDNSPYNTGLGDVRIGWWPDENRQFVASGGGWIKYAALFDMEISSECVARQIAFMSEMTSTIGEIVITTEQSHTQSNNCSGHGSYQMQECVCNDRFNGPVCSNCALGYYDYPDCYPCSNCESHNGTCVNSTCICQHGFTGQACDRCEANRYGAHCLPYPVIQSVDPPLINDIGGINITLYGVNFNSSEYRGFRSCKFFPDTQRLNATITEAVIVNDSILICPIPVNQLVLTVQWFLRLMINGTEQDYSTFNLQVRFLILGSEKKAIQYFFSPLAG
ncbi:unnamed protein product [Rotaria sp. Silwood1]|nr:unnamed protein product [Rotaria sp. Silwood1]